MILILAFLFCGTVCLFGEIIICNTKLNPGHVTSLFSLFGSFLGFLNIYQILIKKFDMGATMLISNFGNSLYSSALEGYKKSGIIGLFRDMLSNSSLVLTSTIIFSFIFICLFKSKD